MIQKEVERMARGTGPTQVRRPTLELLEARLSSHVDKTGGGARGHRYFSEMLGIGEGFKTQPGTMHSACRET
jgi:hypothetical protein